VVLRGSMISHDPSVDERRDTCSWLSESDSFNYVRVVSYIDG